MEGSGAGSRRPKTYGSGLGTTRFKLLVTGIFELDVAGNSFSNIVSRISGYGATGCFLTKILTIFYRFANKLKGGSG